MTMGNMTADIFAVLPAPILEEVLVNVWDLPSLHSLYQASFTVFSLLNEDGVAASIFEAIMARSATPSLRILIRKVAMLRCNHASILSVDTFISQYILTEPIFHWPRVTYDYDSSRLPRDLPGSVAAYILSLAATAYYLAHAGMHEMIDRCMALELYQMQNPSKRYIPRADRSRKIRAGAPYFPNPKTARERYQQQDAGPPFLLEEQRAIRAIWQIWLVWELYISLSDPRVSSTWPTTELQRLQNMEIGEFWKGIKRNCIEQVRTMMQCSCLYPELASPVERFHTARSLAKRKQWQCPSGCPPELRSPNDRNGFVDWESSSYGFILARLSVEFDSPCRYVEFRVFRPYGFAIWHCDRSEALGLGWPGSSMWPSLEARSTEDAYVRWESILSPEELEEIERKRKYYWPGREWVHVEERTG